MKQLRHLLAADVRRFKAIIPIWIAVVAAGAMLTLAWPVVPQRPGILRALGLVAFLLGLAHVLLSVVLVPLVVQTHPAVGNDAFWMTRPIPPRTLLASKLALLSILLLAVPMVSDLALMAIHHVPAAEMTRVAVQSTLFRMLFMAALMAAAAVTRNLARFAVLCGAALLLLATSVAINAVILLSGMDEPPLMYAIQVAPVFVGSDATAAVVEILLLTVAAVGMVSVQYRGRSVRRSLLRPRRPAPPRRRAAPWRECGRVPHARRRVRGREVPDRRLPG